MSARLMADNARLTGALLCLAAADPDDAIAYALRLREARALLRELGAE